MIDEQQFLSDEDFDMMAQNIRDVRKEQRLVTTNSSLFVSPSAHDKCIAFIRMRGKTFNLAILKSSVDKKFFRRYDMHNSIPLTQYQTNNLRDILSMMEL